MIELKIKKIFPTIIGEVTNFLPTNEHKKIVESCYKVQKTEKNSKTTTWLSGEHSPYSTFETFNLVKSPMFQPLIESSTKIVNSFAGEYGDFGNFFCHQGWVNIYKKGSYQEPHSHININYSAVYFPKAPQGSGSIVFQNPSIYEVGGDSTNNSFPTWVINPVDNMLLVFKSNLRHYVLQGTNKEDRISIAMNFVLSPESYNNKYKI
jgi:uncharacterized protein (TIGR02466 family)